MAYELWNFNNKSHEPYYRLFFSYNNLTISVFIYLTKNKSNIIQILSYLILETYIT